MTISNQTFHYTSLFTPKRVTSLRVLPISAS